MHRKKTRQVSVGKLKIGGNAPITVQSMCNTPTFNIKKTLNQINSLDKAGCDIVRLAIPDKKSALALEEIRKKTKIPIVADIHFDYKLALMVIPFIDKLRINPGNIGSIENIKKVVKGCKENKIPIRIGVNSGSIEKKLFEKYGRTPIAMVKSALSHVKILESLDFFDIILSLKASSVNETIEVYQLISKELDYPLHIGVTESGTSFSGTIKSSIGIGALLSQGIGDTLRVSLTDDPVNEVKVGIQILKSLGLRGGRTIISCPTCGRTEIDIIKLAKTIEDKTRDIDKNITIAVMGCVVNGPGEAIHADYGVAGGKGVGIIFKNGKVLKKVNENEIVKELLSVIMKDI